MKSIIVADLFIIIVFFTIDSQPKIDLRIDSTKAFESATVVAAKGDFSIYSEYNGEGRFFVGSHAREIAFEFYERCYREKECTIEITLNEEGVLSFK